MLQQQMQQQIIRLDKNNTRIYKKNQERPNMQPITPSAFPKRVKRFQSYSMTPLDYQIETQNQLPSSTTTGSNKFSNVGSNQIIGQQTNYSNTKSVTNQFSKTGKGKLFESDRIIPKQLPKDQLQNVYKKQNSAEFVLQLSEHKKHRKMITSDIFVFSSMMGKNSFSDEKNNLNLLSKFKTGQRISYENDIMKKSINRIDKKQREIRVPNFLLNKKKQNQNSQISNNGAMTERDMTESTPVFQSQNNGTVKRSMFKKSSIQISWKRTENQSNQNQFCPPSNQKITFSKATTSTLCTNLPRQQSRRTFKDFNEMEELKQIQNSMEESDNSYVLHNEFQNLFGKEEISSVHTGLLQSQIAELFSDEDGQSEEFNEDLQHQLEGLF